MKTIAFFNNKGGVGKTTLICNIAAQLGSLGHRVLVIDADPQCNATQYMLRDEELNHYYKKTRTLTIYNFISPLQAGKGYGKDPKITKCNSFNVDLLPGDPRLALTEDLLATDWSQTVGGEPRGIQTSLVFF